ncbi:putative uncharacterized protein [Clostridium sp. CAG:411]|mgnify:FL=1|jgi:predicted transcriptional regulator|nr:hypothetical protein [Lachnospiraceae bacterium]CDE45095.1 putative uncharacterized protein [Clostridium sp. CAG:411]
MSKKIEDMYVHAMEQITPDVLDTVLQQKERQTDYSYVPQQPMTKKRRIAPLTSLAGIAIAAVFFLFFYNKLAIETIVTIDVNPSFEVQLNRQGEVRKITGVNKDGKEIVDQLTHKSKNLNTTIDSLLTQLDKKGYFSEKTAILVSVQNKQEKTATAVEKTVKKHMKQVCKQQNQNAVIYTQLVSTKKEITEVAKKYNISTGRATFIYNMTKTNADWNVDDLASMTIEELVSSVKKKGVTVSDILEQPKSVDKKNNVSNTPTATPSQKKQQTKETDKPKEKNTQKPTNKPNSDSSGETKKDTKKEDTKPEKDEREKQTDKDTDKKTEKKTKRDTHNRKDSDKEPKATTKPDDNSQSHDEPDNRPDYEFPKDMPNSRWDYPTEPYPRNDDRHQHENNW